MPEISRFFGIVTMAMFPRVVSVRYVGGYRLELTFSDGFSRELDLTDRATGRSGLLRDLGDVEFFRRVRVDPEAGTLVWPNGVDFCPDVLYSLATRGQSQASEAA